MQVHAINRRGRFTEQFHWTPWPRSLYWRAPAGHVAKQGRAYVAQRSRLSEPWPPARAGAFGAKRGAQRTEAEIQRGVPIKMQVEIVRDEHRIGIEQFCIVEPDFRKCCKSVHAQTA